MFIRDYFWFVKRHIALFIVLLVTCIVGGSCLFSDSLAESLRFRSSYELLVSTDVRTVGGIALAVAERVADNNPGIDVAVSTRSHYSSVLIEVVAGRQSAASYHAEAIARNTLDASMRIIREADEAGPFDAEVMDLGVRMIPPYRSMALIAAILFLSLFVTAFIFLVWGMVKRPILSAAGVRAVSHVVCVEGSFDGDGTEPIAMLISASLHGGEALTICAVPLGGSRDTEAIMESGLIREIMGSPFSVRACRFQAHGPGAESADRSVDGALIALEKTAATFWRLESLISDLRASRVRILGCVIFEKADIRSRMLSSSG